MHELETKIGVMVAVPVRSFKGGTASWHPNLKKLLADMANASTDENSPYEFQLAVMEGGLVRARNTIAHEFKKQHKTNPNLKWLLTLDDDIDATVEDVLRLLTHKKPLVGALYTTREAFRPHWVANFMHEVTMQKEGLLQVIECGTGCKLHHIGIFEHLEKAFPTITYTDRDSGEKMCAYYQHCAIQTDLKPDGDMLTEDYFFDYLCRMAKVGIFVDTKLKLKHRGHDQDGNEVFYPVGDWPPVPIDT